MRGNYIRTALGFAIVLLLLAHVSGHFRVPFIDSLESIIYDTRLRVTMPGTKDPRIVILEIDEKSVRERERGGEGRWPWPRNRLAVLLDTLFTHYGVSVVGFDVVFSERDESSGLRVLEQLREAQLKEVPQFQHALDEIRPQLDYDDIFAARMKGRAVVLGYTFVGEHAQKGLLPKPVLTRASFPGEQPSLMSFAGYTGNLSVLQKSAASAGHFNPFPDDDGITRRVPMLVEYAGSYYEPLSLAVVRFVRGLPPVKPMVIDESLSAGYGRLDRLAVGTYTVPVDEKGAALVPYRGPRESFPYYSLVDVLNRKIDVSSLKDKIVLIGATAPGLLDLRATPVDPVYPGVEIHANLISGLLDGNIKHKPSYATGVEFTMILVVGAVLALWLPALTPKYGTLAVSLAVLGALGMNLWFFQSANMVFPLASVLTAVFLLYVLNMAYGFFVEARGRRQITGLFGHYVPPQLVNEMAKDPRKFSMAGESRDMSVLFTDIRGFTSIAEGLDPKSLSQLMNAVLTPLTEVIYKHHGTIDKYMGDCVMAFWGAPVRDSAHARNAVLAALEMQSKIKDMQPQFSMKNWPEIRIGVGLNSGRMSVGNMGSRVRLAYTVMGDAVNLASRLEGITKEYGADIIVGEDTTRAAPEFLFKEIDRVRVKGREKALTIFEPLGLAEHVTPEVLEEARRFGEALELYRKQNWSAAEQQLAELKRSAPVSRLYDVFLDRIAFLRLHAPGAMWDGSFTFNSK